MTDGLIDAVAVDLRRHARRTMLRDIVVMPTDQGQSPLPAIMHDLSEGGACVSCARQFTVGDEIQLGINLTNRRRCTLSVRVIHGYQVSDGWWVSGVQFLVPRPDQTSLVD